MLHKSSPKIRRQRALDQIQLSPLAKGLEDFQFDGTPINESMLRDLTGGGYFAQERNAVLIGGTGTGNTIWRSPSPEVASGPAYTAASITCRSRQSARGRGPQRPHGRIADHFTRVDFVILNAA
jgi:hypothetical protein